MDVRPSVRAGVLFLLSAVLAGTADAAQYKVHWLIGHANLDYFEEAAVAFKNAVEKGSGGEIEVKIVHQDAAWEYSEEGRPGREIVDAVEKGEVEMGHSFTDVVGRVDHGFWAFDLPYLFRDYEHLEGVFEGKTGDRLLAGLQDHKMVGLTFTYSGGANGVATTDRVIRKPEDLKGLRVATFGDEVDRAWLSALGATPVEIRHRQGIIRELARQGAIDGVVTTWRRFQQAGLEDDFKYVNLMGSTYLVSATYMNQKFYDGLPRKYQKLIMDASREAGRIERAKTIELNEMAKRNMTAKGVRQTYLTEENLAAFSQALRPVYKGLLNDIVGKELVEVLRKTGPGEVPVVAGIVGR